MILVAGKQLKVLLWTFLRLEKNSLTSFYFLFTQTKEPCSLIWKPTSNVNSKCIRWFSKNQRENERPLMKGNHMSRRSSLPASPKRTQPLNYIPHGCIRFLSHATFNRTLSSIFVSLTAGLQHLLWFFFFGTVKTPYVCLQWNKTGPTIGS